MNTSNDVTILVCCHKKDYFYDGPGFLPIQVGKAIANVDLGIQGDGTGDNISAKNPNYCELTAHYWLWKNGPKTKYVGLSHYRRYFDFNRKLPYGVPFINVSEKHMRENPPTLPDLDRIFEKYDIVLAKRNIYQYPLRIDYCNCHIIDDLLILEDVIRELYPEYMDTYNNVMRKSNRLSPYNMNVVRRETFNAYSLWLFNILFEVEKRVKISAYPVQARIFGYMSERLLNVYVHHHKMKVKYVPIVKVCDDRNQSTLKGLLRAVRNNITAFLLRDYRSSD